MWELKFSPHAARSKVHITQVKQACEQIVRKQKQRESKTYQEIVIVGGSRIFLAYQFHEGNILYVKEARFAKK